MPSASDSIASDARAEVAAQPVDFDAKYAGWSRERLAAASTSCAARVKAEIERVARERVARGACEAPAGSRRSFPRGATVFLATPSAGASAGQEKLVVLRPDESPDLAASRAESEWLLRKLREIDARAASAQ